MANTYYDATGVLVLDKVTPVIEALFGAFHLDANYPGGGEVYIATISEQRRPSWDAISDALAEVAKTLSVKVSRAKQRYRIRSTLLALAAHFGTAPDSPSYQMIEHHRFESEEPELTTLFGIAQALNDGHGLSAIKFEGSWHCTQPRIYYFGGHGTYISAPVSITRDSHQVLTLGPQLHRALALENLDEAAAILIAEVTALLSGITSDATRKQLQLKLATLLTRDSQIDDVLRSAGPSSTDPSR